MEFPAFIAIGPWQVHPHPFFETLAYLAGFQTFLWLRRRVGDPAAGGQRPLLVLAAIAGALAGSKLLAWFTDPVAVWHARGDWHTWAQGKSIVGGLLGGLVAVESAKRFLGLTRATGDLYAVPLCLGIAIGRVGCFLTGLPDRTYGTATSLPWGVDFGDGITRHPTQLYEVLVLVALGLCLAWLLRTRSQTRLAEGDLFRAFMLTYLAWRLAVGFIQPGPDWLGLSAIQWAASAGLAYYAHHAPRILAAVRPSAPPARDAAAASPSPTSSTANLETPP